MQGKEYPLSDNLIDKNFNLKLSYDHQDADGDGTEDSLKLGMWIDNKLYNDAYIMIDNESITAAGKTNFTYDELFYGRLFLSAYGEVTIGSWKAGTEEDFRESEYAHWEKRTFNNFYVEGQEDGTITGDYNMYTTAGNDLRNRVFEGNLTFKFLFLGKSCKPL